MIDLVIPTMWVVEGVIDKLQKYVQNPLIKKIILIDNNPKKRPADAILSNSKIELVCYGYNIFVNPAWNEGYLRSTTDVVAFVNDDIFIDDDVFNTVDNFNLKPGEMIGVNLRGYKDNYKIDDYIDTKEEIVDLNYDRKFPIGGQAWAFGICMFIHRKTYKLIPSLYKVWYGDDYLAQHADKVYALNSNKIKGEISGTLKTFEDPNSEISKRIELDSINLVKHADFFNDENWDISKKIVKQFQDSRESKNKYINILANEYQRAKTQPSDIYENVHILYDLAQECQHVTEMGVRTGVSTRALLNSNVELVSYDIELNKTVSDLFNVAKIAGKNAKYIKANVLTVEIDETDMLFIDTLHTYTQLEQELNLHAGKVKKYIAFHDTHTFGLRGEVGIDNKGLLSAIIEFLVDHPEWRFKIYKTNNNGFTVLERVN
jgi:hypothetical protein